MAGVFEVCAQCIPSGMVRKAVKLTPFKLPASSPDQSPQFHGYGDSMGRSLARFSAEHTARLARIELSPEQADKIQSELEKLLAFVGQIDELELDHIDPFYGSGSTEDATRPDVLQPSSPRSEVLGNAPKTDGESFLVPPVFGQQESRED